MSPGRDVGGQVRFVRGRRRRRDQLEDRSAGSRYFSSSSQETTRQRRLLESLSATITPFSRGRSARPTNWTNVASRAIENAGSRAASTPPRTCLYSPSRPVIVRVRADGLSWLLFSSIHFCLISNANRRGTRVYAGRTCVR